MDSKQIDKAMRNRTPVIYNGERYARILEYVLWYNKQSKRKLSVVLLAEQGNYSVRVLADKVKLVEDENGKVYSNVQM